MERNGTVLSLFLLLHFVSSFISKVLFGVSCTVPFLLIFSSSIDRLYLTSCQQYFVSIFRSYVPYQHTYGISIGILLRLFGKRTFVRYVPSHHFCVQWTQFPLESVMDSVSTIHIWPYCIVMANKSKDINSKYKAAVLLHNSYLQPIGECTNGPVHESSITS